MDGPQPAGPTATGTSTTGIVATLAFTGTVAAIMQTLVTP